jgi:hypothetical protein
MIIPQVYSEKPIVIGAEMKVLECPSWLYRIAVIRQTPKKKQNRLKETQK